MTEFQRKTYNKVAEEVDKFIPDDDKLAKTMTPNDIARIVITVVNGLSEAELDALMTLTSIEVKKHMVVDRIMSLMLSKPKTD